MRTDEVSGNETGAMPDAPEGNGGTVSEVNGYVSSSVRRNEESTGQDDDDFMAIQPAEVEESWKKQLTSTGATSTSARSSSKCEENEATLIKPSQTVDDTELEENVHNKTITEDDLAEDSLATSSTTDVVTESDLGFNLVEPTREATSGAVARQLFRFEMMREATNVLSKDTEAAGNAGRLRPSSMPQMDTPLSDTEE